MPAISRKGDSLSTGHDCVGSTTLAAPGQSTVKATGEDIARIGDSTVSHPFPPVDAGCPPHVANVNAGSPNVFVEGIAVARVGDSADAGAMTSGSASVFANS